MCLNFVSSAREPYEIILMLKIFQTKAGHYCTHYHGWA